MIDRKKFFDGIRHQPFDGKLNQQQVNVIGRVLDEWEFRKLKDLRKLAYIFATIKWETANMRYMKEAGSQAYLRGKRYWPWIGRGLVQLTWKANYEKFRKRVLDRFGKDIIANPDFAMDLEVAVFITYEGMYRGEFTGKKLDTYFNDEISDWYNARRIINGVDKANHIAGIAKQFYADLNEAKE